MTSKQEYLKKYLGGGGEKKKKKIVKKATKKSSTIKILDDNPDWKNSPQSNDEDDSDTPIIVGKDNLYYTYAETEIRILKFPDKTSDRLKMQRQMEILVWH